MVKTVISICHGYLHYQFCHTYLKNIDCLSFVLCPLLVPHLPRHFLTVLITQTRQVVQAINQSFSIDVYEFYTWRKKRALNKVDNCWNINIFSYCYLVVKFLFHIYKLSLSSTQLKIRHLWQLKIGILWYRCLICAVLFSDKKDRIIANFCH